jgi:hypothetical protein
MRYECRLCDTTPSMGGDGKLALKPMPRACHGSVWMLWFNSISRNSRVLARPLSGRDPRACTDTPAEAEAAAAAAASPCHIIFSFYSSLTVVSVNACAVRDLRTLVCACVRRSPSIVMHAPLRPARRARRACTNIHARAHTHAHAHARNYARTRTRTCTRMRTRAHICTRRCSTFE